MFVVCFVDRTFVQNGFGGELEERVVLKDDDGLYWFGRKMLCVIGFGGELEEWVVLRDDNRSYWFGRESKPLCNWIWRRIGGMGCFER